MAKKLLVTILLCMTVILSLVQSNPQPTHDYCPTGGSLQFSGSATAENNQLQFDYSSKYLEVMNFNQYLLFVKRVDETKFEMKHISPDGTISAPLECQVPNGYQYFALQSRYLILKSTSNPVGFKVCRYQTSVVTQSVIAKPDDTDDVSFANCELQSIAPIGLSGSGSLLVAVGLRVSGMASTWIVASFGQSSGSDVGKLQLIANKDELVSNNIIPQKSLSSKIVFEDGNYRQVINGQFQAPSNPIPSLSNPQLFRLRGDVTVAACQDDNGDILGNIWIIQEANIQQIVKFDLTISAAQMKFKYFSDNLNNFIRLSSTKIDWITLQSSSSDFRTSSYPILNAQNILHIGFSQNIASILYAPEDQSTVNTIIILEHLDNDVVAVVHQKVSIGMISDETMEYRIVTSCLCRRIQAFVCFSRNLNCIVLKKAADGCNLILNNVNYYP